MAKMKRTLILQTFLFATIFACLYGVSANEDLRKISEDLWKADSNRLSSPDIQVNLSAAGPTAKFFTKVNEKKLTSQTFQKLKDLISKYGPSWGDKESFTNAEQKMNTQFVEAVVNTNVMKTLEKYLISKGMITDRNDLKKKLLQSWFKLEQAGRFGFRHVMIGEHLRHDLFMGLHGWLSLYLKEKNNEISNYRDIIKLEPIVIRAFFDWNGRTKDRGSSFLLGSSPEFDIAIYTLCFFMQPNQNCNVSLNKNLRRIRVDRNQEFLQTAYFIVPQ